MRRTYAPGRARCTCRIDRRRERISATVRGRRPERVAWTRRPTSSSADTSGPGLRYPALPHTFDQGVSGHMLNGVASAANWATGGAMTICAVA